MSDKISNTMPTNMLWRNKNQYNLKRQTKHWIVPFHSNQRANITTRGYTGHRLRKTHLHYTRRRNQINMNIICQHSESYEI